MTQLLIGAGRRIFVRCPRHPQWFTCPTDPSLNMVDPVGQGFEPGEGRDGDLREVVVELRSRGFDIPLIEDVSEGVCFHERRGFPKSVLSNFLDLLPSLHDRLLGIESGHQGTIGGAKTR